MPHGACIHWNTSLLLRQVLGEGLTALAYASIPISIIRTVRTRPDWSASRLGLMFALFIFFCGGGHLLDILTIWQPYYDLKANWGLFGTATASCVTAVVIARRLPGFLAYLSAPKKILDVVHLAEMIRMENVRLRQKLVVLGVDPDA